MSALQPLNGKVALVTGGAGGIGVAPVAMATAREGIARDVHAAPRAGAPALVRASASSIREEKARLETTEENLNIRLASLGDARDDAGPTLRAPAPPPRAG